MALIAKYPAVCAVCTASISPGGEILRSGRSWAHVACATSGPAALFDVSAPPATAAAAGGVRGGSVRPTRPARRQEPVPMVAADGALEVWTDGACSGNPGPGGWAWATRDGRQASGGAPATTNQRMEVQAALEAVRALDGPLTVVSDSTYVVNCFRDDWWRGWLARGWLTSAKKPVANRDLWEPLIMLVDDRQTVSFRWVKGHSGDQMNDLVDALAVEAGRAAVP